MGRVADGAVEAGAVVVAALVVGAAVVGPVVVGAAVSVLVDVSAAVEVVDVVKAVEVVDVAVTVEEELDVSAPVLEVLVLVVLVLVEGVADVVVELDTSSAVDGPQLTAMTAASANAPKLRLLANSCRCGVSGSGKSDMAWEQFDDLLIELVHDAAQRKNVQNALAVLQQVHDLFATTNEGWLAAVHDEVGGGDVLAKLVLQVGEHFADLFQADAGVEQVLDHLELEKVAIAVLAT